MSRWTELSEKAFAPEKFQADPRRAEAYVGPIADLFSSEDLDAFRESTADAREEFQALLQHPLHRHLVKLLVFATRHVPDWLVRPMLVAAADTVNPSFNKHFVIPCSIVHGRRRVVETLIDIAMHGSDCRKAGAVHALYWGEMRKHVWPDDTRGHYGDETVEPIDDLMERFHRWVAQEFVRTESVDVKRSLVGYLKSPTLVGTELGRRAIQAARNDDDEFVRDRIIRDLGEAEFVPSLPHRPF